MRRFAAAAALVVLLAACTGEAPDYVPALQHLRSPHDDP